MRARRIAPAAVTLLVGLSAFGAVSACAGSSTPQPSLSSVDFRPKVVIEIRPDELHFATGPREDRDLLLDPPTFGSGTVTEITNTTATDQRLQGNAGKVFDTGIMKPRDTTTVVFTNATSDPVTVAVMDPANPRITATIVVRPKPTE